MLDEFVALDLETTGLSLESDLIIEVGATRFDRSGRFQNYRTFINPGRHIPPEVVELTGISDADVADAPRFSEVRETLREFLGTRAVVGQNIAFDLAFLNAEQLVPPGPAFDTWELASVLLPTADRLGLGAIAEILGVHMPVAHRALADAEATRDVFLALLRRLEAMPRSLLVELRGFAGRAGWSVTPLLEDALERAGAGTISPEEARAVMATLPILPPSASYPALVPREPRIRVQPREVDEVFAIAAQRPDLMLAFERRSGQEEMARAVAEHLRDGGYLAVEAGTGTGKSLAYLVPALLHAMRNDDRVVVSTHTRNLQDQLAGKDAPAAAALVEAYLDAPGAARVAVLKGRSNYLCLERWAQVRQDPAPRGEAEVRLFARVAAWLPETETGDLAELYMTSQEQPWWPQISAESNDCLARRCSYVREGTCFLWRARQRAAAAHIVIANHSLLLANAARDDQVLPSFNHLVVDEAHRLEDVATQHFGATLSTRDLRDLVESLSITARGGEPGFARRLQGLAGGAEALALSPAAGLAPLATQIDTAATGTRDEVRSFMEALRGFVDEAMDDATPRRDVSLTPARRGQASWEEVETVAVTLDLGLRVLGERLTQVRETVASMTEGGVVLPEDLKVEANRHAEALAAARDTVQRTVLRPHRDDVAWVTRAEGDVRIGRAPLEVAPHLAKEIWAGRESVMATSATLAAGASFDFATQRLGLDEADTLIVPSPYDYRRAVLALLAEELPDPGMPSYDTSLQQTIGSLVRASQGRTLVLFTSHAAVRATAAALRDSLAQDEISVLAQGVDGSPTRLLRLLNERPRSVILGTAAFWEGIDVPGEALSQIVIARLPFPVPTDPIYEGRSGQFDDPFAEFALPQAVLRFRQGFGRLIRGSTDRGVFVVLDSRIVRRQYGEAFLDGLPDCEVRTLRAADLAAHVERWLM
ncbi:MAG: exonuclease domain-containing protein [Dehalococcoidia bacterium]|nr:exonuclease domain-containing protein [Dehalococcoidia bacterium]